MKRLLIFLVMSFLLPPSAASAKQFFNSPPGVLDLNAGYCGSGNKNLAMNHLFLLREQSVYWRSGLRINSAKIVAERIEFGQVINGEVVTEAWVNLATVLEPASDIDIQLAFAMLEGELLIYWRETFQNRVFRQGLQKMNGESLVAVCEGQGGRTEYH